MCTAVTGRSVRPRSILGFGFWVLDLRRLAAPRGATRGLVGGLLVLATLAGCGRTLTIRQDHYINTGGQANRPADKRTGEPLEVDVVCVYPKDLDKAVNEPLRPESRITCKDWYERRPVATGEEKGRFDLRRDQIFLLTNDDKAYGKHFGNALRGAALDGEAPIRKTGINFGAGLHDSRSVIYVFPKFIGKDGGVLPVPPAKFHPPGAYVADLEIKIGVDPDRSLEEAQYVKVLSERKMHGSE